MFSTRSFPCPFPQQKYIGESTVWREYESIFLFLRFALFARDSCDRFVVEAFKCGLGWRVGVWWLLSRNSNFPSRPSSLPSSHGSLLCLIPANQSPPLRVHWLPCAVPGTPRRANPCRGWMLMATALEQHIPQNKPTRICRARVPCTLQSFISLSLSLT